MDNAFLFDMPVAMYDLFEDKEGLFLWDSLWMIFDVIGKGTTLKQFHNNIEMVIEDDNFD